MMIYMGEITMRIPSTDIPQADVPDDVTNIAYDKNGILSFLEMEGVGPTRKLRVELSERLSLITGDNGLGKTFILESAWWALSGSWAGSPAYPRDDARKDEPRMAFRISGMSGTPETCVSHYDWKKQVWRLSQNHPTVPGLLIYMRADGAFAVWDPVRNHLSGPDSERGGSLVFTREDVWDGLRSETGGRIRHLCNGLINDWINWQNNPAMSPFRTLEQVLRRLSPPDLSHGDLGVLKPGKPARIPGESRLIPTIHHPYGEIPIIYASASVRRIVAMAYLIVWAYHEHKEQARLIREQPQKRLVILSDEIEAHLHPQWQRTILPALISVTDDLEPNLRAQFLVTTHSPLVMASAEPLFDTDRDAIFHLDLLQRGPSRGEVILEKPEFARYGSANSWLMSDIFKLDRPYSVGAEKILKDAKKLQLKEKLTREEVRQVSERLIKYLPAHDPFWSRWTFFAEQHGVEL